MRIVVGGQVPTFFLKQQAQELLRRYFGEIPFINRIEVVPTSDLAGTVEL
ncbi:MAG: hypothetical protein U0930_04255 [Pirellulales bacterium]